MSRLPMFPVVVVSLLALLVLVIPISAERSSLPVSLTPYAHSPVPPQPESTLLVWPLPPGNPVCGGGGGGSGWCAAVSDPTPTQYSTVVVACELGGSIYRDPSGWPMTTTWHFESGTQTCTGTTDGSGIASCSLNIGAARLGYRVNVDVSCGAGGPLTTWFTPEVDCSTVTEIPPSECEALEALYNKANGAGWTNHAGWVVTDTPCTWDGVTCNAQHVASLDLSSNQLSGSLPPDLGKLTDIETLRLGNNRLTGSIPPDLRYAYRLRSLDLSSNLFGGNLPRELGDLHTLTSLRLDGNQLTGSVPPELGNLAGLTQLDLSSNQLTGCLPQSLTNLHALQSFHFDTERLWIRDNPAFAAWYAGIPDRSLGPTATCKSCYLAVVGR